VQIKMAQSAGVGAKAKIALDQQRLRNDRNRKRGERRHQHDERATRIEPDNSGGREHQLETGAQKPAAEFRQLANLMNAVAALGHVRFEAALKIAVAEQRNLSQKGEAQANFQSS